MRAFAMVAAAFAMNVSAQVDSGLVTLHALRDHARPLLIFAARPDDPQLAIQLRTLRENAPGVAERDLVGIAVPYANPAPAGAKALASEEASAVRRRFGVAPADFLVILIGKDGGEKLRSSRPIPFARLAETIDAMPMRKDEMRGQVPR